MIIKRSIIVPILILLILFTSIFVSLNSIFVMPQDIMGGSNAYVLTSSTDRNPLRSNLDINIAYGLENTSYITAVSPEIFLFTTVKNEPVTVRGVIFTKFLQIENGKIIKGSLPHNLNDALVGEKLFNFLHLKIGEKITVSGSFQPSIAIINITGVFHTGGVSDDEILINLLTAQKLAGLKYKQVSIIRFKTNDLEKTRNLMDPKYPKFTITLNSTSQVYMYDQFNVTVTIENIGYSGGLCSFNLEFQNQSFQREIYIVKNESFNITLKAKHPGDYRIIASVKNDVLFYSTYLEISVLKNPVIFEGKILSYVNTPTHYKFLTRNNTKIENATLKVYGDGYSKIYHFNYSVNVTFPKEGPYILYFEKEGFENKSIEVKVFKKVPLELLASINPSPIGYTIPLKSGTNITISTENGSLIYYSIDNGVLRTTNSTIPLIGNLVGTHTLEINVVKDWMMGNETYIIHIYNSSTIQIYSPITSDSVVYYNSSFEISILSEIPLKNVSISVNKWIRNINLNQSFKKGVFNYTYNFTVKVKYKRLEVEIYTENILGTSKQFTITPGVIYSSDIIKPEIIIGTHKNIDTIKNGEYPTIEVWSGESFIIRATDNLNIMNLTVYIFDRYFNASSEGSDTLSVTVPTMFIDGNDVNFLPEGIYQGEITAIDSSKNENKTEFYVIINNSGENIPPLIRGNTILQFESPDDSYSFKAIDNVGMLSLACYENNTLIKEVTSFGDTNITLHLNYSDLTDGLHYLKIVATDINNNYREQRVVALKNYTDSEPPSILPPPTYIWSGENIIVEAVDNVKVKKLAVYAFDKWFNGTNRVVIPTKYEENNTIKFMPEGIYTLTVDAWDIFDNHLSNPARYDIEINNSGEKLPPIIVLPNVTKCSARDNLTFMGFDNVGVDKMWIEIDNLTVAEKTGGNLTIRGDTLGYGILNAYVFAKDKNGNVGFTSYKVLIMDNVPPKILNKTIKIWSGNTTNVTLWDNIGIKQATLVILNQTWKNIGNGIEINTMTKDRENVTYVQPGIYYGSISVEDFSGNLNSTTIELIIDNTNEKNPPIIIGEGYNIISEDLTAFFRAFDNVGIDKMWWSENGNIMNITNGDNLTITINDISLGLHPVTIYAQDVNGNVAFFNTILEVKGIFQVDVSISIDKYKITTNERGVVNIEISNGPNPGKYNNTVYLDDEPYYSIELCLNPYDTRSITFKLPYLEKGTHIIKLDNQTLKLQVEEPVVEKLPIDLILKYNKELNVTGGKNVIYKGFQISEGNFVLVIYTLISIGIILVALGMYSSILKGMKNNNVAILRAIGANNKQIIKFTLEDVTKYLLTSIIGGIFLGYLLVIILEKLEILRAFGHRLIIYLTPSIITGTLLVGFGFLFFTTLIILKNVLSSKVVHLMGTEKNERIVSLGEVLNER